MPNHVPFLTGSFILIIPWWFIWPNVPIWGLVLNALPLFCVVVFYSGASLLACYNTARSMRDGHVPAPTRAASLPPSPSAPAEGSPKTAATAPPPELPPKYEVALDMPEPEEDNKEKEQLPPAYEEVTVQY